MNKSNLTKPGNLPLDSESKDLNWLAFCYIADELNPSERIAFEARLLECEATRDAVVDAMRDSQTLFQTLKSEPQLIAPVVATIPSSKTNLTLRWTAAILATAAAVLITVNNWSVIFPVDNPMVASESDGLASAWVETLITMSEEELDEFINEEIPQREATSDGLENWMFVALTESDIDSSQEANGEAH